MKIHDVQQGSQEWLDLHVGIPTASRFHRLVTPKTQKASKDTAVHTLAYELAAEYMVGGTLDTAMTQFMQRGLKLEGQALKWYAFERNVDVERVGFVTLDDGSAGCSPDGLVGADGGVDVKCPAPPTHVKYLSDPEQLVTDYRAQLQGCMWVCERNWWDICSWHPSIPSVAVRLERDEKYIDVLKDAVGKVTALVDAILKRNGYRE